MAVPKLNHTQTPNYFIDNYMAIVSGAATKVFMAICRKTIGWHKETDRISLRQLEKITGLARNSIKGAIEELLRNDLIETERKGRGRGLNIFYNIKFERFIGSKNDPIIDEETGNNDKIIGSEIDTIYPLGSEIDPINQDKGSKIDPKYGLKGSKIDPTKDIKEININKDIDVFLQKIRDKIRDDENAAVLLDNDRITVRYRYCKAGGFISSVCQIALEANIDYEKIQFLD